MPTKARNFSTLCAGILVIQIFTMGSLPFELLEPWDKVFHMLAFGALTLLIWIAADGRRPMLIIVGVMALGLADEIRQAFIPARSADALDFFADALAAAIVGATLYWNTKGNKKCAESSQQ
jgi:VanZ family protein